MKVGIIGLGYVGLPLAVAFGEAGHDVVGVDTDARVVERLAAGRSRVEDVPSERLAALAPRLTATTDHSALADCDAVLICVPTPLANQREPDLSYIADAGRSLAGVLREGQLVVLESTTYPGTTRERLLPILEESGLAAGRDFHLAFSPERIDPGRADHTLRTTPKVVGGITEACRDHAVELYGEICDQVIAVSTPEAAEMSKLISYHDPHVAEVAELDLASVPLDEALGRCDVACVVTAHAEIDYQRVVAEAPLVVDFRGVTRGITAENLIRL